MWPNVPRVLRGQVLHLHPQKYAKVFLLRQEDAVLDAMEFIPCSTHVTHVVSTPC